MRLFYIVVCALLATALLTPWVVQALYAYGDLFNWPFSRIFDRVLMLVLATLIIANRKKLSLSTLRPFLKPVRPLLVLIGVGLSLVSALFFVPLMLYAGVLSIDPSTFKAVSLKIIKVVPAAFLIAVIEESFFRVLILNAFRKSMPLVLAVFATSLLYAVVHFVTPDKHFVPEVLSWDVGLQYLALVVLKLTQPGDLPSMLGLFIVGWVLGLAVLRTDSIWLAVGLHAGWVMVVKLVASFSSPAGYITLGPTGERYFLVSQPVSWLAVVLVGLLVIYITKLNKVSDKNLSSS